MQRLYSLLRMPDADCIRAIRQGGPQAAPAMSALYKKYKTKTRKELIRLIRQHPVFKGHAEDLMHDAFIIILHKIQTGATVEVHSFCGLWIRVAKNIFLNELRKDERFEVAYEPESAYGLDEKTPEVLFMEDEEKVKMEALFALLGPRCKDILVMWSHRYTMAEIAHEMQLANASMARKLKYDCFKKLKEWVRNRHK